eukprot:Gregarina_sp_Pseudo_9__5833@NODE_896_length_2079_cov_428_434314_g841_i0_p1_GENE_NODE_896_length_2079_cov_428_434314_g841_i0NODE_896_length_2079_cov_428_434314_g841_i0_p1_ORF_typecomplete_len609_score199_12GST_C_3/PF14497_6/6_9e06GST_C_3/PF14497_6/0_34GST_C_3/PF14497_6/2_4e15GST_N/PF02798_20/9_6e08GST_N/PF02798_20/7_9e02GST_N/PF02798_20/1_1e09GST_N_3/PF13417_6/0_0076GST_N_3/PF13417_6/62GST_N_3/PF13417_6/4e06GST_C/PF00043_25/2_6GST_C/PF00043_25/9_2GST_C/PF00043_25/2e05GST_N_4/PF17172_4/0_00015GST_
MTHHMHGRCKKVGGACCRKTDSLPSLFYFDSAGRAEAIRFTFLLGGVEFRDVRFQRDADWMTYWKLRSPTGKAPWLEVDGAKVPETRAILMYAAKKANLVPVSQEHAMHAEMLIDVVFAMMDGSVKATANVPMEEKYKAAGLYFVEMVRDRGFVALDKMVAKYQSPEGFIVGSTVSYVDAFIATVTHTFNSMVGPELSAQFRLDCPALFKTMDLVYSLAPVKNYLLKYPAQVVLESARKCWQAQVVMLALETANIKYVSKETETAAVPVLVLDDIQRVSGMDAALGWVQARFPILPADAKGATLNWEIVEHVRDVFNAFAHWEPAAAEKTAAQIDKLDARLRDLYDLPGAITVADIVAAVLYETVSQNSRDMKFATRLHTLAESYTRVHQVPSVRRGVLTRSKPSLYYFDIPGRAESIRYLLNVTGVPFDDVRFGTDEFASLGYKAMTPTGQAPFLKIGNEVYVESVAIMKMLGEATGLEPITPKGKVIADSIASAYGRVIDIAMRAYRVSDKTEERIAYRNEHVPEQFDLWEKVAKHYKCNGDWLVENRLTWIDFFVAGECRLWMAFYKYDQMTAERFPTLMAIYDRVQAMPAIQKYHEALAAKTSN